MATSVAGLLLALSPASHALLAQRVGDAVRVRSGTALRAVPGGEVVGVSSRELPARVESAQSGAVKVTVRGFVPASLVTIRSDGGRGTVSGASGAPMRDEAARSAGVVAEFRRGTFLFPVSGRLAASRTGWLEVRRSIWVDTSRVRGGRTVARETSTTSPATAGGRTGTDTTARAGAATAGGAAATGAAPEAGVPPSGATPRDSARPVAAGAAPPAGPTAAPPLETAGTVTLHAGPRGAPIGSLVGGTPLVPLARDGGWVRVRFEGWLPDSSAVPVDARPSRTLSAADLRADPVGTRGRVVRWDVEALAFQRADGLRRGLAEGEAYLLARGPADERSLLYLAVPDSLAALAQGLPPLTPLAVTARVRDGRSEPSGVPVLELLGLVRR